MSQVRGNRGAETILKRCFVLLGGSKTHVHSFLCQVFGQYK